MAGNALCWDSVTPSSIVCRIETAERGRNHHYPRSRRAGPAARSTNGRLPLGSGGRIVGHVRLLLTAAIIVVLPHLARAECIALSERISARDAVATSAIVFSGTVIKIEDPHAPGLTQVVTFEVNRVWKGPTTKQQVIHHLLHTESRVFTVGDSLVVFGWQLDAVTRTTVGLSPTGPPAFGYRSFACGADHPIEFNSELPQLPSVSVP
jgi:hypothetical protein